MTEKITDIATHEVTRYVEAYLVARAYAETMREEVNKIYRDILTECPVCADDGTQILSPDRLYLCSDDDLVRDVYAEANKREREAGLKPADMPNDYCPALVAETLKIEAENRLIEAAGRPLGIDNNTLLCAGLDKRQRFIDLVVGLVLSLPNFKKMEVTND